MGTYIVPYVVQNIKSNNKPIRSKLGRALTPPFSLLTYSNRGKLMNEKKFYLINTCPRYGELLRIRMINSSY